MEIENFKPDENQDRIKSFEKPKRAIKIALIFVLAVVLCFGIFGTGYYIGTGGSENIKQRLVSTDTPARYKDVDFSRFWEAVGRVEDKFIGNIDYEKLVDGAINGAVSSLGDPFSTYFDKKTLSEFDQEINGTIEGIGAEMTVRNGKLTVISPIAGSPAEKADIRAGDVVNLIDESPVASMTLDEAIMKIRGKKGTTVNLNMTHANEDKAFDVKINREEINVKSLDYKINSDGTVYIRILRFDTSTKQLLDDAATQIQKNKAKGIVLDLRNNPGGYLESSVDITSQFIKEGVVVYEEYKDGHKEGLSVSGTGKLFDIPMVVIVNGGSASAAEIVAGAIHDHGRGQLIGEKTFGKGSVQEMETLSSGGALKITIAKWLTPNGTAIDKNGLLPDIEVKWVEDSDVKKDNQLDRAYEELGKIKN